MAHRSSLVSADMLALAHQHSVSSSHEASDAEETTALLERSPEHVEAMAEARMWRSTSSLRWVTLGLLYFSFVAAYFIMFSIAPLQQSLTLMSALAPSEFQTMVATAFFCAIVVPLWLPKVMRRLGPFRTLAISNALLLVGQMIFIAGMFLQTTFLFYVGRVFVGVAFGVVEVSSFTLLVFWFGSDPNGAFGLAYAALLSAIDVALVTARYLLPALEEEFFVFGALISTLLFPLVALIAIGVLSVVTKKYFFDNEDIPQSVRAHSTFEHVSHDFSRLKQLSISSWMAILSAAIALSYVLFLDSSMTGPAVEIYNLTQRAANDIIAVEGFVSLVLTAPLAGIIATYGFAGYWALAFCVLSIAVPILLAQGVNFIATWAVFSVCLVTGVSFSMVIPNVATPGMESVVTASFSFIAWIGAAGWSAVFGLVRDLAGNYEAAMIVPLVVGVSVLVMQLVVLYREFAGIENVGAFSGVKAVDDGDDMDASEVLRERRHDDYDESAQEAV